MCLHYNKCSKNCQQNSVHIVHHSILPRISVRHSGRVCFLGGVNYHIKALELHLLQDQRELLLTEIP